VQPTTQPLISTFLFEQLRFLTVEFDEVDLQTFACFYVGFGQCDAGRDHAVNGGVRFDLILDRDHVIELRSGEFLKFEDALHVALGHRDDFRRAALCIFDNDVGVAEHEGEVRGIRDTEIDDDERMRFVERHGADFQNLALEPDALALGALDRDEQHEADDGDSEGDEE